VLLWLSGITVMAAALRLVWLDAVPGGLFFDVAANLFDVLDVQQGARPLWFSRNNGREPIVIYLQAAMALHYGATPSAAKTAVALLGILAVPATYLFGRETAAHLGEARARHVGLLAAFAIATMYWHVHFSRLGLRTIALPLFMALALGLLLRAIRRESWALGLAAGVATGLTLYTYTAARLLPLALAPFLVLAFAIGRRRPRLIATLGAYVVAATVVAAPMALQYARDPSELGGRSAAVSILNPEVGGGDPLRAAARGLAATAGAIVVRGTDSALENLPGRPLAEPLTGAAFVLGLGIALGALLRTAIARAPAALLLLSLGAMALSPALSVNPPGFVRISGMIAPLAVLVGLGLEAGGRWIAAQAGRAARPLIAATLALPLVATGYDYFWNWAPSDAAYRATMADKVEGAEMVRGWLGSGDRVFLAPLYARDYTYRFLLRDQPVESFDLGAALVLPGDGRAAVYAFPPEDRAGLVQVASRIERPATFEVRADASGQRPLLTIVRVEGSQRELTTARWRFDNQIGLVGAWLESGQTRPGGLVTLALHWLVLAQPSRDYSVFVHARDARGQTRFQRDRMPGDGSLPTGQWRVGDLIGDYYDLEVPRGVAAGEYRLVVGLYDLATGRRLHLTQDGQPNEVEVARVWVG
jgi:hypothetical protein